MQALSPMFIPFHHSSSSTSFSPIPVSIRIAYQTPLFLRSFIRIHCCLCALLLSLFHFPHYYFLLLRFSCFLRIFFMFHVSDLHPFVSILHISISKCSPNIRTAMYLKSGSTFGITSSYFTSRFALRLESWKSSQHFVTTFAIVLHIVCTRLYRFAHRPNTCTFGIIPKLLHPSSQTFGHILQLRELCSITPLLFREARELRLAPSEPPRVVLTYSEAFSVLGLGVSFVVSQTYLAHYRHITVSHTWCAGNHRHSIYCNIIT